MLDPEPDIKPEWRVVVTECIQTGEMWYSFVPWYDAEVASLAPGNRTEKRGLAKQLS
jgi:hypothetical protein